MGMFWRGEHTFQELHALGGDIGSYPPPQKTYYVDQYAGSDGNTGLGSWGAAKQTFQAGITAAIAVDNCYLNVDLIVGPGEYDEQAVVTAETTALQESGRAAGDVIPNQWLGYKIGRFRIICMGKAVVFKNSGATLDSSHTLDVQRMKTEIYGGTWRNYTDSGDFAAIHFDRTNVSPYGDVINAKLIGAKIEGRSSAQIGVDIDAAQYVWIERCVISGWDTGILVAANGLGAPIENVIRDCYFRGNTDDILLGGSQFTLMQDNVHADDGTTQFVGASDYSTRIATNSDCLCVGARLNTTSINSGKFPSTTGVAIVDTHTHDR